MSLFELLVKEIGNFIDQEPIITESRLEEKISDYIKSKGIMIENQVSKKEDRYDLICRNGKETVCVELKIKASIKDIKQFDRYFPKFRDGFIVVCWQASFHLKMDFESVKKQSPIPIELIELSKRYSY
ncbi:MAG: hypothetical protein KGI08_07700 [Thaumarchaeota archaeon]|nr:hypothetical protein [Nitrososphaerota archaeon]